MTVSSPETFTPLLRAGPPPRVRESVRGGPRAEAGRVSSGLQCPGFEDLRTGPGSGVGRGDARSSELGTRRGLGSGTGEADVGRPGRRILGCGGGRVRARGQDRESGAGVQRRGFRAESPGRGSSAEGPGRGRRTTARLGGSPRQRIRGGGGGQGRARPGIRSGGLGPGRGGRH